jgi:Tol biopolymer transport system component
VFVRDLQRGVTERASAAANGRPPDGASYLPAISGDGRWGAFVSNATDLAAGDRAGDGGSTSPALSQNGRFVAFQSNASDLVCRARCPRADEDVNLVSDVFVFDRDSGLIRRVSQDPDGGWLESSVQPAIDPSGRVVVFSSRHPTDEHDLGNDSDLFVWTACAGDSGR